MAPKRKAGASAAAKAKKPKAEEGPKQEVAPSAGKHSLIVEHCKS